MADSPSPPQPHTPMTPERWQEVKRVLAAVLERTPAERRAYLDETCPEPVLRHEVQSLLLAHEQGQSALLDLPAGARFEPLEIGARLGPYEILSLLGEGGMGVVYRARDTRLDREVAIKILSAGLLADQTARRRFREEALALAKLNHANIAAVYDVGEHDGIDYLVLECVPGSSLAEIARSGQRPEKEIDSIGSQIAAALQEAHERGIVHRDLKPANVMITPKQQVKVLDFGLAKLLRPLDTASTQSLPESRAIVGTLPYMAPEQLLGEPVDARTDIHALGLILFEMASGRRLFQDDSVPRLTDAILHRQPVTPRAFNSRLSPELERIILKCIEKDPENRYQSAKELSIDLRRLDSSASIPHALAQQPSRRASWPVFAGAIVLAAAIVTAGAYFYFHRAPKLTEKDSIVIADFANSTGDPVFDGTLRQGLVAQLQQTPYLQLVSDQRVAQTLQLMEKTVDTKLTPAVAREVCQRANATVDIEGSIAPLGNQYVLGLNAVNCGTGDTLAAEQVTADGKEKVLAALGSTASSLRSRLGESSASLQRFDTPLNQVTTSSLPALQAWSLANQAFWKEDFPSTVSFLQRAVSIDPNFALAYSTLGGTYGLVGQNERSLDALIKGYQLRDHTSEREKFSITSNYEAGAIGDLDKAVENAQQWAKLFPRDPVAFFAVSAWSGYGGRPEDMLPAALGEVRLNPTLLAYHQLIWANMTLGRFDDARATLERLQENHFDLSFFGDERYTLAALKGDSAEMARLAAGDDNLQAFEEARTGRVLQFRESAQRLSLNARQYQAAFAVAALQVNSALFEALDGNFPQARKDLSGAGNIITSDLDLEGEAGAVWALIGDTERAQKVTDDLNRRFPQATSVRFGFPPAIQGLLAIRAVRTQEGIELLRVISSRPLLISPNQSTPAMIPVYVSGEAYLAARQPTQAAAAFQMILDHPNLTLISPIGSLAHLGLARAYVMQGDTAKARVAYQDFLRLWKDADPDLPVLNQAKSEYAALH